MSYGSTGDNVIADSTRSRTLELLRMKYTNETFSMRFLKIFEKKTSEGRFLLTKNELIHMCIVLQVNPEVLAWFGVSGMNYGGMVVLMCYIPILIILEAPMFAMGIFLGSYGRRGYLRMWECIPLLKGVGYTIALLQLLIESFVMRKGGLSLLYVWDMFDANIPWHKCDFPGANKACVPINNANESISCNPPKGHIASIGFLRTKISKTGSSTSNWSGTGPLKWDWALMVWLAWIVIFVFVFLNFKGFTAFFRRIHKMILVYLIVVMFTTAMISLKYDRQLTLFGGIESIYNSQLWINMLLRMSVTSIPGTIVYLSSIAVTDISVANVTLKVFILKLVVLTLFMGMLAMTMNIDRNLYNSPFINCSPTKTTTHVPFAILPEVLSCFPIPQLWYILWYLVVFFMIITKAVYCATAALNSFTQTFPVLGRSRIIGAAVVCLACGLTTMPTLTPAGRYLVQNWTNITVPLTLMLVLLIYSSGMTFIYTTDELVKDYEYTYGQKPAPYWIYCWRSAPIIYFFTLVCLSGYNVVHLQVRNAVSLTVMNTITYCASALILTPILVVPLSLYFKHLKKKDWKLLLKPEEKWGPLSERRRKERRKFNPQMDISYNTTTVRCPHNCLLHSARYSKEATSQKIHHRALLTAMNEEMEMSAKEKDDK